MTDQNALTKIGIDEPTAKAIMRYYGIDNHDQLARYIRDLGIERID
jgi:hypothetical protein